MTALVQSVTVLACLLFTGAAVYITLVEHPARLTCDTACALSQWTPSYKRATVMQASLAVVATLFAVLAWLRGSGVTWVAGAVLIFSVVPTTLLIIMPTNKALLDPARDPGANATRELLVRWGRLHAIRTGVSFIASVLFLMAVLWP
jgi:uncharacterized membrane protein